ncbi:MAG: STAS domain-containing protein [Candidatus Hydrogenedentes bacterium]|nr:STAS domain-containing protein [Candidatus Hydrogenedentota bacterium]
MSIEIKINNDEQVCKIEVIGQVDLYTSPELRKAILSGMDKVNKKMLVELSNVEYMDSSGVATLVEGLRSAMKHKKEFYLVSPSPAVRKVLNLARLESVFTILESDS